MTTVTKLSKASENAYFPSRPCAGDSRLSGSPSPLGQLDNTRCDALARVEVTGTTRSDSAGPTASPWHAGAALASLTTPPRFSSSAAFGAALIFSCMIFMFLRIFWGSTPPGASGASIRASAEAELLLQPELSGTCSWSSSSPSK
eukprot:CAMPEP_0204571444 /NCGR_PEP_ID=MMETSP0661-20131031/38893_1 /ASSEMBLY_ACC=CAM_ASM_000606 /TAXON_ID=109239 /ORGANISM="Alexandrium margalefi, Strain AMGDE01CS-322" /LENGTH=144 /DNA_ID=CAMNT_0051579703 /DNA_START=29 /DNA_END=464 /DNA_ORIENTATION=+